MSISQPQMPCTSGRRRLNVRRSDIPSITRGGQPPRLRVGAPTLLGVICLAAFLSSCNGDDATPAPDTPAPDTPQGWTDADRQWYYDTSQGSRLIRYTWLIALEQRDNEEPFLADEHVHRMRFLANGFDPSDAVPRLPVGFAKDGDEDWFGFTCAACHTTEIEYGGQKIRIDGGGTLGDMTGLLRLVTKSVNATIADPAKFERFATRVLGPDHDADDNATLASELAAYGKQRDDYDRRNYTPVLGGFGRLDAFGRIFNTGLWLAGGGPDNFNVPDGPVSIPFLWGTDQSDYVQWIGNADDADVGRLGRNVGEVLGVFAQVDLEELHLPEIGYRSSVRARNLIDLEQHLRKLEAPSWHDSFPPIDEAKAARGAVLYQTHCVSCHHLVERSDVDRKVVAWMEDLDSIGTDPVVARNTARRGKSGILEGRKADVLFGAPLPKETYASAIVAHIAAGMLEHSAPEAFGDEWNSIKEDRGGAAPTRHGNFKPATKEDPLRPYLAYKGRPLTGIWATAPYLHNGSVPSLHQLLLPPDQRVKTFYLGSRTFDPVEVGLEYKDAGPDAFVFQTEVRGNWNTGHEYGTDLSDAEREKLIEYMKTAMSPGAH